MRRQLVADQVQLYILTPDRTITPEMKGRQQGEEKKGRPRSSHASLRLTFLSESFHLFRRLLALFVGATRIYRIGINALFGQSPLSSPKSWNQRMFSFDERPITHWHLPFVYRSFVPDSEHVDPSRSTPGSPPPSTEYKTLVSILLMILQNKKSRLTKNGRRRRRTKESSSKKAR